MGFNIYERFKRCEPDEKDYFEYKPSKLTKNEILQIINIADKEEWEELNLSTIGMEEVPREIGKLKNLKILCLNSSNVNDKDDIYNNKLHSLPEEICKLENLEELYLYECRIKQLPMNFIKLKKLRKLNLNGSELTNFPVQIYNMIHLEILCISGLFDHIPKGISKLNKLKELHLPDLLVTEILDEIGELRNLESLSFVRSKFAFIPKSFTNLNGLKEFEIDQSSLSKILPPEIRKQKPVDVINYLVKYSGEKRKKIRESKLLIVGQGGVGKTCLANRIIHNKYDDEEKSTQGISINMWNFIKDNKDYHLNMWDFGGQEIYHATHQFFLTRRSLYLFVWDVRQEEEYGRIDYWLNTIESFADDSPIIMIINKCDERNNIKSVDFKSLQSRFSQLKHYVQVSVKKILT